MQQSILFALFCQGSEAYRERKKSKLQEFDLSLLDDCLTCNPVHLIVDTEDRRLLSDFIRELAGEHARAFNHRKGRQNAYWGDNYPITLIDTGTDLWRCLLYLELNRVRCGAVNHLSQWDWVGYHEIMGHRHRYRLLWRLNDPSLEEMRNHLEVGIPEALVKDDRKRQAAWTEGLALGSQGFVEAARGWISSPQKTEVSAEENDLWVLLDEEVSYTSKMNAKESSKAPIFNGYFSYYFLFNALLWQHRKIQGPEGHTHRV